MGFIKSIALICFALTAFTAFHASAGPAPGEIANAACSTIDMNHAMCAADSDSQTNRSVPGLILHLCSNYNAWGTSNVFVNCAVNAVIASRVEQLINPVKACFADHTYLAEYFVSRRATCIRLSVEKFQLGQILDVIK